MCTVSFVTSGSKIIITSNRDELANRPALFPAIYEVGDRSLLFPKDPKAGGTWFAAAENDNVVVLLNGAAEAHDIRPPYRKSRGLVVLELLAQDSALRHWKQTNLENIEPFTLVLFENRQLYQLRWDGNTASTLKLDSEKNYIWSSATLYPKEVRDKRSHWFYSFMEENPSPSAGQMLAFHQHTESANTENGLVIKRTGNLRTLSITQVVIEKEQLHMKHLDLVTESVSETTLTAGIN